MKFNDKLALLKQGISLADIKELEKEEKAEIESKLEDKPKEDDHHEEPEPQPEPKEEDDQGKDDTTPKDKEEPDYKSLYEKSQADLKKAQDYINKQDRAKDEKKPETLENILQNFIS